MKKITLKISAFLLLTMFALQVQAQGTWTENGIYKISEPVNGLFMTLNLNSGALEWQPEITPDDQTQLWTIIDHPAPASPGYMQITCNITSPPLGIFRMGTDDANTDTATSIITVLALFGDVITDTTDPLYGYDQFQRRKTNPAPPVGNNALFIKTPTVGNSRYGVQPAAAGESVVFDKAGIDTVVFDLITPLSTADFDTSSIFISNPVNNQLSIKGLDSNVNQVSVYSLLGKQVLETKVNGRSELTLDTRALSSGMYIVKMSSANGSFSKKIVKQ